MKLTPDAIKLAKKNRRLINLLALEYNTHSATIERWIEKNEHDGDLTKVTSLKIIGQELNISEKQILSK